MDHQQDSTRRNQEHSPLLRLPAELRNKIYDLALGDHTIVVPYLRPTWARTSHSWHIKEAALHYTCRQIRHETAYKHFALNTFAGDLENLFIQKNLARHKGLQYVRCVQMTLRRYDFWTGRDDLRITHYLKSALDLPRELKGLEYLVIEFGVVVYEETVVLAIRRYFEQGRKAAQPVSILTKKQ